MKKSKFSEAKIVEIVRESRAQGVAATARKHQVSDQSLYTSRRKYGGMQVTPAVDLKRLSQESAPLKKLLAESDLAIEVMQEIAANKWRALRGAWPRSGTHRSEGCHAGRRVAQ